MKNFKRYLVTSALPYANGPIHIGHLAGVYVPADIYVRFLRLKGEDVIFICGSDEYGVPITIKAKQEGVEPQQIVDRYHKINKEAFEKFGISFDIYSRTTSKVHFETSSEFFKKLYEKGEFIEKNTQQFYDEEAKQFLADRYVTGTCPRCSSENAYGDQCEACGSSLNATDLLNPKSALTGKTPVLRDTKHWFLPLDKHEAWLKQWILEEHKEWKPNVYGQCKSWLDSGLQPRAVTRDLHWGVPVPLEEAKGKVLYVWFEAPIGYISATKELTNEWEKYWKDKDTKLVHFIGKDNIVFHCLIFPAILKAEGTYILPDNVPANEFLNLENDKISTSRNWAVWLNEYLNDFPDKQDVLRYVLTAISPETKDNDFTWKDFQARNNNELVAILGNYINRVLTLTHKYFNGIVPQRQQLTEYDSYVISEIREFPDSIEQSLQSYRFREAQGEMLKLARLGNKYLTDSEPWKFIKTDENRVKTVINISLQIIGNLSVLMEPFLPFTAKRTRDMLNIHYLKWTDAGKMDLIPEGTKITSSTLLFEKIDDSIIAQQLQKLAKSAKIVLSAGGGEDFPPVPSEADSAESGAAKISVLKENIYFEDFQKIDIRTGTIIAAEKVPKTQKLLKLTVDTGIDKRMLVAGIAEFYTPEEIIGKKACFVVNLAPKNIIGIQSNGMILMAENSNGELCFISPTKDFPNGSVVK